jgi:hypothetical protein
LADEKLRLVRHLGVGDLLALGQPFVGRVDALVRFHDKRIGRIVVAHLQA